MHLKMKREMHIIMHNGNFYGSCRIILVVAFGFFLKILGGGRDLRMVLCHYRPPMKLWEGDVFSSIFSWEDGYAWSQVPSGGMGISGLMSLPGCGSWYTPDKSHNKLIFQWCISRKCHL